MTNTFATYMPFFIVASIVWIIPYTWIKWAK